MLFLIACTITYVHYVRIYNFCKANLSTLYDSLLNTDWPVLQDITNVNEACRIINEMLH